MIKGLKTQKIWLVAAVFLAAIISFVGLITAKRLAGAGSLGDPLSISSSLTANYQWEIFNGCLEKAERPIVQTTENWIRTYYVDPVNNLDKAVEEFSKARKSYFRALDECRVDITGKTKPPPGFYKIKKRYEEKEREYKRADIRLRQARQEINATVIGGTKFYEIREQLTQNSDRCYAVLYAALDRMSELGMMGEKEAKKLEDLVKSRQSFEERLRKKWGEEFIEELLWRLYFVGEGDDK